MRKKENKKEIDEERERSNTYRINVRSFYMIYSHIYHVCANHSFYSSEYRELITEHTHIATHFYYIYVHIICVWWVIESLSRLLLSQ